MRRERREGNVTSFASLELGRKICKIKIGIYICKLITDARLSSCVSVTRLCMQLLLLLQFLCSVWSSYVYFGLIMLLLLFVCSKRSVPELPRMCSLIQLAVAVENIRYNPVMSSACSQGCLTYLTALWGRKGTNRFNK